MLDRRRVDRVGMDLVYYDKTAGKVRAAYVAYIFDFKFINRSCTRWYESVTTEKVKGENV